MVYLFLRFVCIHRRLHSRALNPRRSIVQWEGREGFFCKVLNIELCFFFFFFLKFVFANVSVFV
jgi:hypothetical protein